MSQDEALEYSDKNIMARLWDLMNSADVIAGHNINRFDAKKINARFLVNGFTPPLPYKTIDTLSIARRKYSFESNTLDYLCTLFGLPNKDKMHIEDWDAIQDTGDPRSLRKMMKYNKGDVKNGAAILNILRENNPELGMRTFRKEPQDTRKEHADILRGIADDVHNLGVDE